MAMVVLAQGYTDDARHQVEQILREHPNDGPSYFILAQILANQKQFEPACHYAQRALELAPGLPECHKSLCVWLVLLNKNQEAVTAAREGLRLDPMNAELHFSLALALKGLRSDESTSQAVQAYRDALHFNPNLLIAINNLAWLLATEPNARFRDGKEAVRLAEHAYELAEKNDPLIAGTLAAAYAEAGRYPEAIASAQKAVDLARSAGDENQAATNQTYLELYRANHPLRQ